MARRQGDGNSRKVHLNRRTLLQAVGAGGLLFGGGLAGTASGQPVTDASTVVDLGEEGLTSGDNIDPYLEQHFTSETEIHIPAGEYSYSGAGLGGTYSNAGLIGSPEGVTFKRPDDPEVQVRPTMVAEAGSVRLENITVAGPRGQTPSYWRVGAASDATFELVNVNFPDGTVENSGSMGIYAGTDHGGSLWVKNCHFSDFADVALHVADPQKGQGGRAIIENCTFANTGTAIRCGSTGTTVRGCYFEATEPAPASSSRQGQRGIEIDEPGTDVVVEDCDFQWGDPGTAVIEFDDTGEGGGGSVRDIRVGNGTGGTDLFSVKWTIDGSWSGENINITEA